VDIQHDRPPRPPSHIETRTAVLRGSVDDFAKQSVLLVYIAEHARIQACLQGMPCVPVRQYVCRDIFSRGQQTLQGMRPQDKRLLRYFFYPLVVVVVVMIVLSQTVGQHFPHDLSPKEWELFSEYLFTKNDTSSVRTVCILLFMQMLHTLMCVPFLHVTQMLMGYYIGTWWGLLFSGGFEVVLVSAFVLMQKVHDTEKNETMLRFIDRMRKRRRLYAAMVCLQMSSIPVNSSVCIVMFGSVTPREFIVSHCAVSFVMTLKNVAIGDSIRSNHSGPAMTLCVVSMVVFSVLPTVLTLCLSASVYGSCRNVFNTHDQIHTDTTDQGDASIPLTDVESWTTETEGSPKYEQQAHMLPVLNNENTNLLTKTKDLDATCHDTNTTTMNFADTKQLHPIHHISPPPTQDKLSGAPSTPPTFSSGDAIVSTTIDTLNVMSKSREKFDENE